MTEGFKTTSDVAALFGVTQETVYKLVRRGSLAAHRLGNKFLFSQADIDDFLAGIRVAEGESYQDDQAPARGRR